MVQTIEELRQSLRPGQQSLADWEGGKLAIAAVPGAGKSHSLAIAAAITIARYQLHPRQQLAIVTFTRSAAANIKSKIREKLQELQLPQSGFIVQTLHGLALNIASRHPQASGLNLNTSTLITPTQNHQCITAAVERWLSKNPDRYQILLEGKSFDGEETERQRRQLALRKDILPELAKTAIQEAKSSGFTPEQLRQEGENSPDNYSILSIAAGLYEEYEQIRRSRDFIDYDDMILAALKVLEYPPIRNLWQNQIFAVFEDEAQDSSPLQNQLLEILATTSTGEINLIRVGDPNQAINSTFTPADPLYFNHFCNDCEQKQRLSTMDQAGRSTLIIQEAANRVITWVNETWQLEKNIGETPFRPQKIRAVDFDDPQPDANPKSEGKGLEINAPEDIYETVHLIRLRAIELLTKHPQHSVAILVRENRQGHFIYEQLAPLQKEYKIKVHEVGEMQRHSRIPGEIFTLLSFLDRPHSSEHLKAALEILESRQLIATQDLNALAIYPEQFLYPIASPLTPPIPIKNEYGSVKIKEASRYCRNLLRAKLELPSDRLISFLGMVMKYNGSELATVEKLAERILKQTQDNKSLKNILKVLEEIINSERFEGVEEESDDLYTAKNQITIITMHKAKGLDWDYVFIPFLHADSIPGEPWVPSTAKFLGDFTLSEVARVQIRTIAHNRYLETRNPAQLKTLPSPQKAWLEAKYLQKAEEYRLLYVAMTRAKRLLWLSAEKTGPFRWSVFNPRRPENFQEKKSCPILPQLYQVLQK